MFEMLEFIERKRDGFPHTTDDLAAFVDAVRDDLVPFRCHIQSSSSTADLMAVGLKVRAGNSSDKLYLFTTPNFLRV